MELYSMLCGSLDGVWGRMNTCVCMTESLLPVNQLCVCMQNHFSHVWFFVTVWTVVHQALLSMGFSRQEHWSGLLFPSPGDLPNSGVEPVSLASPALRQILYHWATREATIRCISIQNGKFKFWKKTSLIDQIRDPHTSVKGQRVNTSGFVGHTISVVST